MVATDFQDALLTTFISELEDFTNELDNDIVLLESSPEDEDLINKIFRAYHSIKSSAGIVGYKELSDFTHIIETVFEKIRKNELKINTKIINGLLDANDILRHFLEAIHSNVTTNENDLLTVDVKEKINKVKNNFLEYYGNQKYTKSIDEYKKLLNNINSASNKIKNRYFDIFFKPSKDFFKTGNEPLLYIKDLAENGKIIYITINTYELPDFMDIDTHNSYLSWNIVFSSSLTLDEIKNLFLFIIDENEIKINEINFSDLSLSDEEIERIIFDLLSKNKKNFISEIYSEIISNYSSKYSKELIQNYDDIKTEDEQFTEKIETDSEKKKMQKVEKVDYVRVDIKKLDELLNLIGELVINHSQVQNLILKEYQGNLNQDIVSTIDTFHRLTKEIQEKVMKVRMLPVGPMFNQFFRFTRDVAQKLNKKVKLTVSGVDTELDKTVIEKITDPLRHIVRNSIDHGIESPEERIRKGKNEEGNVKLSAYHREGNVYIEIEDDGRGMNIQKILDKAIQLNLTTKENSEHLTDEQIINFIFEPGFSTADQITDLSGRGVGMDVVKNNIEELKGSIYIKSEFEKGTKIQIVLPLTLSIIEAMIIRVGDLLFVINIMSVVEIIKPESKYLTSVEEKAELLNIRGEFLPLVRLYKELNLKTKITNPEDGIVVIVEAEKKKYCLMADELVVQQQVVIKSMDKLLDNKYGITGTTILGDGKIAFILDIPSLINFLLNRS